MWYAHLRLANRYKKKLAHSEYKEKMVFVYKVKILGTEKKSI